MKFWLFLLSGLFVACGPNAYRGQLDLESQMEREIAALRQRNRLMKEQIKSCNVEGPATALYSSLYQLYNKSPIEIIRKGRATTLIFPVTDLFSGDELTVRREMHMYLDLLASVLKSNPDYLIRIEGHTDNRQVPYELKRLYADNWMFAMGRAIRLMDSLVKHFEVDEARFSLSSKGEYSPRDENDTESGRSKNNRIVVTLYPKGLDL